MKKNFKRWLAFLLAVVLVATSGMFRSESFLQATDEQTAESPVVSDEQLTLNDGGEIILPPEDPTPENPVTEAPPVTPENPVTDVPPVTTEEQELATENPVTEVPPVTTEEPSTETQSTEASQEENPVVQPEADVPPVNAAAPVSAADAAGPGEVVEPTEELGSDPDEDDLEGQEPVGLSDEVEIPETITVTVNYKKADGSFDDSLSGEKEISLANLTSDPMPVTGYTYSKTTYGDIGISGVDAQVVDGKVVYYVMYEAGDITGIQIDKTTDIVVVYEEVNNVNVTYNVTGVVDTNAVVAYEGVTTTKKGESFNFSVKPNVGYTVNHVTATCGDDVRELTSADGVYVVPQDLVIGDVTVNIHAEKIEKYNINFDGANTIFEFNGAKGGAALSGTYKNDGTPVSFVISGSMQNEGADKVLNKLAITLNGETITIDAPTVKGESVSKGFSDGSLINVLYTNDTKKQGWTHLDPGSEKKTCNAPQYLVTITGSQGGNPYGDIEVKTNYKKDDRYEIWPGQITGAEVLVYVHRVYNTENPLDPSKDESVERTLITDHITKRDVTVYIRIKDGYSIAQEDISLLVTGDGGNDITGNFPLEPCKSNNDKKYGQYKFFIPAGNGNRDIRISVSSKPIERNFNVSYNYNGGTDANGFDASYEDPKTYHIGDTFAVTDGKGVPQKADYVFAGWELNGKTYNQGSIFAINEATMADASNSKYEFIAKWVPNGEAEKIPYNINVYFADEDDQYNAACATIVAYGPLGKTVSVIGSSLNTYLQSVADKLPENWNTDYVVDRANTDASITLEAGTTQTIRISYKRNEYSYTVKYVDADGRAVANELMSSIGYKSGSTIETITPAEITGFYLDSWEVSDPTQNNKFTADTGAFVGGVMPIGGLTITYKYIRKHEVTVTAKSLGIVYNGKEQSVSGFAGQQADGRIPVTVTEGDREVTYYVTGLVSEASAKDANVDKDGNGIQIPVKKAGDPNTEFTLKDGETSVDVTSAVKVTDTAGNDVTRQFKVFAVPGTLKIAKAPLTLESAGLSKVYDGTSLSNEDLNKDGVTVTYQKGSDASKAGSNGIIATGWVENEGTDVTYTFTKSTLVPDPDGIANEFTYESTATNLDNYQITEVYGKLIITDRSTADKYSVTVTAKSLNEVYNGGNQTVNGFNEPTENGRTKVTADNGVVYYVQGLNSSATQKDATIQKDGDDVTIKGIPVPVTGTDADGNEVTLTPAEGTDTVDATAIATIFDEKGNDVTAQFKEVTVKTGTLTIQQKPLTIVSASLKKEYDGTPLSNANRNDKGVTGTYPDDVKGTLGVSGVYEDGWINGEGATYTFANSVTLATDMKANEFEIVPNQGTNLDNYAIKKVEGQLSVVDRSDKNKYKVTITPNSKTVTYDGTKQSVSGFVGQTEVNGEIRIPVEAGGREYYVTNITAGVAQTNAGTYPVVAVVPDGSKLVVSDKDGNVVTDSFNVKVAEVNLVIEKRKITIAPDTGNPRPFNGQEQTADSCKITDGSLADKHSVSAEYEGSQRLVNKEDWELLTKNIFIKENSVIVRDADGGIVTDNYDIKTNGALLKVTDEGVDSSAIIRKNVVSADGKTEYALGDTVYYDIEITNMYEHSWFMSLEELGNVKVTDKLFIGNTWVSSGETKHISAEYVITKEDILRGSFTNTATVQYWRNITNKDKAFKAEATVQTTRPTATLAVTVVPEKNSGYDLNDPVVYRVTVTNTGNLTLAPGTKVRIDKGTVEGSTGAVYTISEALEPNAEASFTVTYNVAEADIRAGEIVNKATAEGQIDEKSYNDLVKKFYPTNGVAGVSTDVTVTTAAQNPQIVLTKDIVSITAADGTGKPADGPVDIGDTITYTIVAKNAGNIALQNVVVEDELTGNTVENGKAFRIPLGFGPNAELRLDDNDTMAQYTVTEADIVAGEVINTLTVATDGITDLSGNKVSNIQVSGGTKTIATQQQSPSLAMVIERAPVNPDDPDSLPDDSVVGLNDEVNYIIRVTNNGNVTIENIKVTDVLTGNVDGEELEIASLAPGQTTELPVTYANVTEADILAGSIVNRASAVGTNKNDANEDTNKVTADAEHTAVTDAVSTAYTVTRTLTDPQAVYRVGETIRYTITITSQANVSLNNVVVSDLLDGTDGNVTYTGMTTTAADGTTTTADTIPVNTANEVTIDSLQPGSTVTLTCEYTVVRADAGTDNAIVGTTNVKADSIWTTGNDAEEITVAAMTSTAAPAPIENMYNLTIHYVYAAGGQAAPDVVAQYLEGETFTYTTPAIDGYTPDYGTVSSGETGMLARDVEVTVVYTANVINIPTTPGTPGGTPVTPGGTPVTPVIMGEPQVAPAVADAAAAAAPAAAAVTTVAAAAPDLVDVEDDEVPLAQPEDGQITEDENGDVDLVPIEDDEVPLANTVIDEHVFCILHYLLFLLTLILAVIYAISLKKQQKRLVILQKGYDEEMRNR